MVQNITEDGLDRIERVVESLATTAVQQEQRLVKLEQGQHLILDQLSKLTDDVDGLKADVVGLKADVEGLITKVEKLDYKFDVFRQATEGLSRMATTFIAGATIRVIAGVILLLRS
jgi:hypothetical protein